MNNFEAIIAYINSRALPVTRQEIVKGTKLRNDQVRKATNDMLKKGKLETEVDAMGVTYYKVSSGKATAQVEREWPTLTSSNAELHDKLRDHKPTKTTKAWDTLVQEAEQRGFAQGYTEGVKLSQRHAYEDGKRAVIEKLGALLS